MLQCFCHYQLEILLIDKILYEDETDDYISPEDIDGAEIILVELCELKYKGLSLVYVCFTVVFIIVYAFMLFGKFLVLIFFMLKFLTNMFTLTVS